MPAVPFGAVKLLQKRTGAESKSCNEALAATDLSEDAAVAYLAQRNLVAEGSPAAIAAAAPQAACGDGCARNGCGGDEGASFLSILRIDPGDGDTFPHVGDRLTMHYRGTLDDGTEFDSSVSAHLVRASCPHMVHAHGARTWCTHMVHAHLLSKCQTKPAEAKPAARAEHNCAFLSLMAFAHDAFRS